MSRTAVFRLMIASFEPVSKAGGTGRWRREERGPRKNPLNLRGPDHPRVREGILLRRTGARLDIPGRIMSNWT
jgi:hypothetical protein